MKLTHLFLSLLLLHVAVVAAPVAVWDFDAEETTKLVPHGNVQRDQPGPRPPEFPDFGPGNTAVQLAGDGAYFSFADPGAGSVFDFTNGDEITVEAWVKMDSIAAGENLYVIGKGRTGADGFAADNQNWALRVREQGGKACVSFLFATPPAAGVAKSDAHWHRWTSTAGFAPGSGWHHLAVAYRFGEPESVRAWLDGQPQRGAWDMGGATTAAPVVDDDAVWIGSSNGGRAANSFRGAFDSVALHRGLPDDAAMAARHRRASADTAAEKAPQTMPDLGPLPPGKVRITFHEGWPTHDRWLRPGEWRPPEITRWTTADFLLPRLPVRFDAWGIRDSWNAPVLVQLAADVALAPGRQRLLLRARGLSRLWVDGVLVAETKPLKGTTSGDEPMTPIPEPPRPGLRPREHEQQEVFGEAVIPPGGRSRVVLEVIAGGKVFRAETGELTVAVQSANGQSYTLLQPAGASTEPVPLTNAAVEAARTRVETALATFDDATRRTAAASQDAFWLKRHALAQAWVRAHPAPPVPAGAAHPVDAFLTAKIERAVAAAAQTPPEQAQKFHREVLPILRNECFRCHGEKEKGGLRLNTREAALKAGDSEHAAVVPGDPAASELLARIRSTDAEERMPPKGDGLKPAQIAALEAWIKAGAAWPAPPVAPEEVALPPVLDDAAFLRRLSLDVVGVPPSETELRAFLADPAADKRPRAIERLLADERWADSWMGYWQDVLAENPTLLNTSLNTTGPFRWFLQDALRDGQPLDRFVTELLLLRGSKSEGGSAGFGVAGENDAPFAAKGHIVGTAFLGLELQCARCHDSPYHSTKQRDLYALAAMFERKPVTVPKSSTVPAAFFAKKTRESLIKVTLKPGESIAPVWPFAAVTGAAEDAALPALMQRPEDPRERLAALVTAPQNARFAQVLVNRVWKRFMGAGFVEPVSDWEGHEPSHPELLDWLAKDFVAHGYDLKHLARRILTAQAYQRPAVGRNLAAAPEQRFFAAPERRRLTAEQVVDSLYAVVGQPMDVEELTVDPDGRRSADVRIRLGFARRAWMMANVANDRDRPSLSLPRAQAVCDVLEAFGWAGARQTPRTERETAPNVLQPGVLANSTASVWLTRAAQGSGVADLAVEATTPETLVETAFLRVLSRLPNAAERGKFATALAVGFAERLVPPAEIPAPTPVPRLPAVTWSNHLQAEANTIATELERRARLGPPPDPRLRPAWRETYEDFLWSLLNTREFVWMP